MQKKQSKFYFFNKTTLQIVGILLIILSAVILVWQGNESSNQAIPTTSAQVYFEGEYKIGDGEWKKSLKANIFHLLKATSRCVVIFIC